VFENACIKGYSIRYSSCALLDCFQIFIKQHGVYCMVDSVTHPSRFKLLYEGLPTAFLFEKAGGVCFSQQGKAVLDIEISDKPAEQRTSVISGSINDVMEIVEALKTT